MFQLFCDYLPSILSITGLVMISIISPGPDFAVVVKNSLIYSRRTAMLTALGIALGLTVHITYALLGIGLVISQSPWLMFGVKMLGASYLIYIGYQGLRAKKTLSKSENVTHKPDISPFAALRSGFLTNALNPKCMLFIVSLFSVVVAPDTPIEILLIYAMIMFSFTLGWFSFVAFSLSDRRLREKFMGFGHWIDRITGGVLMTLGARLLLTV
jgi:RhtB (resistance to homoserine/threonine) family protein